MNLLLFVQNFEVVFNGSRPKNKFLNDFNFDFVFYIAGVDIHLGDRLGKLNITDIGINKRDDMVIRNFFERRIPICGVLGGGYNKDFEKLVELHASLHKNCAKYLNDKK